MGVNINCLSSQRGEFTCHSDGKCISMEERFSFTHLKLESLCTNILFVRCDQFPNCEDFSDEANCKLVVLPENYVIDYAPFTVNESGKLMKVQVQIKVEVKSV